MSFQRDEIRRVAQIFSSPSRRGCSGCERSIVYKGSVWRNVTTVARSFEIGPHICALLCLDFRSTYFGKSVISVFEDRQIAPLLALPSETTIGDQWWLLEYPLCSDVVLIENSANDLPELR